MTLANSKSPYHIRERVSFGILAFFVAILWLSGTANSLCEYFANRSLDARRPSSTLQWIQFERSWFGTTSRSLVLEARAYLQYGETASVLQSVRKLRDRDPSNELADVLDNLVSIQLGDQSRLAPLIARSDNNLPLTDVFEASARCHLFNSDENNLAATFEHWAQFNPSDPAIEYYKGRWDEISDRFDNAISHFEESIKQSRLFLKPRFRRGILLRDLRRFDEALQEFESMIGSDFESIAAVEAAHCLHRMGDSKAAWNKIQGKHDVSILLQIQQYQRADQFVEGNRFALVGGGILESLERYGEAIDLLRLALEANHRDSEARVLLISCLNRLGKSEDAVLESKLHAEMASGKLECKNLADQLEIESTDFAKRIRYATLLFRYKSLGESQLIAENLQKDFPAEAETYRLLASIYRERARESNDWNLRADAQERIALKLEAQKHAPKQSNP